MNFWTGIGSRDTPVEFMQLMMDLATKLCMLGFILRSGGAQGADSFFYEGVKYEDDSYADIFIPWNNFNGMKMGDRHIRLPTHSLQDAELIASKIHPNWKACSRGARSMHTRNVFQVLGEHLDHKSELLVCWAPVDKQGRVQGGTATAYNLAMQLGVPCFNLSNQIDFNAVYDWVCIEDHEPFWK